MVKRLLTIVMLMGALHAAGQEVLLPLQHAVPTARRELKAGESLAIPFFDDFASGQVSPLLWERAGGVEAAFDVSPLAPTVGVATLDALGADGFLYTQATTTSFAADTLCSRPINLGEYTAEDSLVLSFYYLPGGGFGPLWQRMGDAPEWDDSLFVDFYNPTDSSWTCVWGRGGVSVDTLLAQTGRDWQYVQIGIDSSQWMDSLFRFRFRNRASLEPSSKAGWAGNCDQWHLDYILLDRNRTAISAPSFLDVAFAAPPPPLLKDYRAMPYWQYEEADKADSLPMVITNLYASPLAVHYGYAWMTAEGTPLYTYDGGFENAPSFVTESQYQSAPAHASPPVGFTIPAMSAPQEFVMQHVVQQGVEGDAHPANDTVRYTQVFDNYYAYDDGTAENGYGITSTSSSLYVAVGFHLRHPDTLTAIDLFFNSTLDDANQAIPFYLTVWSSHEGHPHEVIYRDATRRFPRAGDYHRYVLEHPVVVEGDVFVGFEQVGNHYINIGFDRSTDCSRHIYYLTSTEWQQSILSGALMLRPCFRAAATLGLTAPDRPSVTVVVYPNPAHDEIRIASDSRVQQVWMRDLMGRIVATTTAPLLPTAHLAAGLYLLQILTADGHSTIHRVLISH